MTYRTLGLIITNRGSWVHSVAAPVPQPRRGSATPSSRSACRARIARRSAQRPARRPASPTAERSWSAEKVRGKRTSTPCREAAAAPIGTRFSCQRKVRASTKIAALAERGCPTVPHFRLPTKRNPRGRRQSPSASTTSPGRVGGRRSNLRQRASMGARVPAQRAAYVVDGILKQRGHASTGALRLARLDRLKHGAGLMQKLVLDDEASPAEAEQGDECRMDEPAQCADKDIVGRVENGLMEAQIRADQIAAATLKALHVRVGFADARERGRVGRLRGGEGGLRLHPLAQLKQVGDKFLRQRRAQMPSEKVGVQRVPFRFGAHAGSNPLARDYQALGGKRA